MIWDLYQINHSWCHAILGAVIPMPYYTHYSLLAGSLSDFAKWLFCTSSAPAKIPALCSQLLPLTHKPLIRWKRPLINWFVVNPCAVLPKQSPLLLPWTRWLFLLGTAFPAVTALLFCFKDTRLDHFLQYITALLNSPS